jgi:peptidoglycan/xylan/chitin deacetylase (PgdA/CDA1 family)
MRALAKLRAPAAAAFEVGFDLVLRRYPAFVTGGALPRGHIPVFCFHGLEPESFGRKLEHLARNGYVTLAADEYFDVLQGRRPAPERAVVLTFDDGRSSVRTIGAPLMRRHGFKGIVFIVPGRTCSRPGPLPPTLDDVPEGTSVAALLAREHGPEAFLSWEELVALHASGMFDLASHSLSHARVHVAPVVEDFLQPWMLHGYGPLDVPWVRAGERELFAHEAALGTPLLRSAPRLSERVRFIEDEDGARAACVALVAAEGGARFFEQPAWRARLRRELARQALRGRFETPEERLASQRRELFESRRQIEARLGRPAPDLCYPWHVSGPTAERLAREAGYRSAYCGKLAGVPISLPGGDPLHIARVGEDYVELLPGAGRGRLVEVLREKFTRRFGALRS